MGVAINFVIFSQSSMSEVGIGFCRFHIAAAPGMRVSFICVAQYSPDHKSLTCKSYNRVKSRVSNERTEAEIMSKFLHLKIGLVQDYGISSLQLKYRSQLGHKSKYITCWIRQTLVHVMACCLRATGHRAVCFKIQDSKAFIRQCTDINHIKQWNNVKKRIKIFLDEYMSGDPR